MMTREWPRMIKIKFGANDPGVEAHARSLADAHVRAEDLAENAWTGEADPRPAMDYTLHEADGEQEEIDCGRAAGTEDPAEIGNRIGCAMGRDVLAEDMPREWTGLDAQDGDRLTAAGIEPDSAEWATAEREAQASYLATIYPDLSVHHIEGHGWCASIDRVLQGAYWSWGSDGAIVVPADVYGPYPERLTAICAAAGEIEARR